ncbi:hypothetical protein A8C46_09505 [Ligilactobacillus salivarius]|uniref:DUF536 domain-containing protein n=1 Tax=Lactobacillaceae TaxID=33958 RepID=UPI000A2E5C0A|nr:MULTISPECIES: DUF536 domain-containing protein [Lactobacillaceae]OTA42759.1 hypothetical protein BHL85_09595 [Limosilactobacillus reuteri]OTA44166.1 hypothetical protein BHL89_08910 [Limosilactobacillus reuteri]OTA45882.1 hypothetical protein BHL74_05150 [Limosilactobacillus reuteri]OTA49436.1 hypothetical protein BHL91_07940 [Limosilactobacillus reuteri]OTA55198.1 hypothetical protein BHL92_08100 [Limosilactobacillus reuteri]
MNNLYTIRQIANKVGVTKPAVTKYMSKSFRSKYTKKQGNRILIDENGFADIKQHFADSSHTKTRINQKVNDDLSKSNRKLFDDIEDGNRFAGKSYQDTVKAKDETIEFLKKQLATKDEQLASMHKLMDQNQQLLLNTQAENQRLFLLQESGAESSKNVQDGNFTDNSTKSSTQDKKKPLESSQKQSRDEKDIVNRLNKKKHWWNRLF